MDWVFRMCAFAAFLAFVDSSFKTMLIMHLKKYVADAKRNDTPDSLCFGDGGDWRVEVNEVMSHKIHEMMGQSDL